jgi:hypothetical protein
MYALVLSATARTCDRLRDALHTTVCLAAGVPTALAITWCAGVLFAFVLLYGGVIPSGPRVKTEAWSAPHAVLAFLLLGAILWFLVFFGVALLGGGYERWRAQDGPWSGLLRVMLALAATGALTALTLKFVVPGLAAGAAVLLGRCGDETLRGAVLDGCRNFTAACPCVHEGALPLVVLMLLATLLVVVTCCAPKKTAC